MPNQTSHHAKSFVKGLLLYCFSVISFSTFSQAPKFKYGDIKPADFATNVYAIDSNASGIILFDKGSSDYEGDTHGGFSVIFKRHTRIRLINRNSFELASISIPLYISSMYEEKIESLEATTYNLENGKVETTVLDKNSIFKDKLSKNFSVRKFTLPNIREGSIIEIKYTLNSPYERELRSWNFQRGYPVLWSQYEVNVPSFYDFVRVFQGYQPFVIDSANSGFGHYNITDVGSSAMESSRSFSVNAATSYHMWAMKDIPALKEENFTTTLDNHICRIDFQLSKIQYPNQPVKEMMNNWKTVCDELLKDPRFGEPLSKNNGWMNDEIKKITSGANTPVEKAKKIYEYVRDNVSCTDHSATYLSGTVKKVYETKNGNVADVNLLLTSLLGKAGFEVYPVLLSTREHGRALEIYPVMDKMNYVITKLIVDDKAYLLDASQRRLGFGKLDNECYNGYARTINPDNPVLINLSADSILETKFTTILIINDEKGGLAGTYTTTYGNYESGKLREQLAKTSQENFFKDIRKGFSYDVEMSNATIDSLKQYEEPVSVKYDFKFDASEDMIYLNPVFGESYKENPFKAAERLYPVEMPYTINKTFVLNMEVPKGYKIEEMPKSCRVKLNDDEGMFEYLTAKDNNMLQLRYTIKLNKANFQKEDYQSLRDFFAYIVKKESEQVVLKKIKS